MKSATNYHVFGLNVLSEIELPELIEGSLKDQPTIVVQMGQVDAPPKDLAHTIYDSMRVYNDQFFFLNLKNIARFLAIQENGHTKITIDLIDADSKPMMKSWFYGSVLTAALQMNNRFALHASAVLHQEKLVMFCGPSGIGKSTIASHLHTRGYPIFSDDKCVLNWKESSQSFVVFPSLKITRLWEDATEQIDHSSFLHSPEQVTQRQSKYQFLLKDEMTIQESKPVGAIYRIQNVRTDASLKVFSPTGIRRIRQLRNQTHRLNFVNGLGKKRIHWDYMERITQKVPFHVMQRPQQTPIGDFVDFVEKTIAPK